MAVYAPEITHPVFQALDIQELFEALATTRQQLAAVPKLFRVIATVETKFRSFAAHRSLHIDNVTFVRWRDKLERAAAIEEQYLRRIAELEDAAAEDTPTAPKMERPTLAHELYEHHVAALSDCEGHAMRLASKTADLELRLEDLLCTLLPPVPAALTELGAAQVHHKTLQLTEKDAQVRRLTKALHRTGVTRVYGEPKSTRDDATQTHDRRTRKEVAVAADKDVVLAELDAIRKLLDKATADTGEPDSAWRQVMACGVVATAVSLKQRVADYVLHATAEPPPTRVPKPFLPDAKVKPLQRQMHPPALQALPTVLPRSKSALRRMPRVLPNQVADVRPSNNHDLQLNLESALQISKRNKP
ncbi:hypothetical protein ACHHYP_08583 [Achlya hypogyna]|uniref:Uncharacterized protein n=1 Tax=Achlya hypogyna TaxID=1202772 RepID=A0A1V9ZKE5_ACHHY|nr:hypothetical protein ACHHYP_08583 [Achlya hypogyna]